MKCERSQNSGLKAWISNFISDVLSDYTDGISSQTLMIQRDYNSDKEN